LAADIAWLRDRAFMTEKAGDDVIFERIAKSLEALDAECERAWRSYHIAHDQAMSNGHALAEARASGMEARQGGNEVPSRSDDSPTGKAGDAHD
jgi:hypothetical protein